MRVCLTIGLGWLVFLLLVSQDAPEQRLLAADEPVALPSPSSAPTRREPIPTTDKQIGLAANSTEQNKARPVFPQSAPMQAAQRADTQCTEVLQNRGFEESTAWSATSGNAFYDTDFYRSGARSAALDNLNGNRAAIWQFYNFGTDITSVTFELYSSILQGDIDDNVHVHIYDTASQQLLVDYYLIYNCKCQWLTFTIPLDASEVAALRGINGQISLEVLADGGVEKANFDDVSLQVCSGSAATATPTATPTGAPATPTATPIPPTATLTATNTPLPPTATATLTPSPSPVADSFEPNNSCTAANPISASGVAQDHLFAVTADVDWLRFEATADVTYRVEAQIPGNSPADVNLELYTDCNAAPNATWNATYAPGARLDLKPPTTGPIYVRVTNTKAEVAGANVTYRLLVRPLVAQQAGALIILAGRYKVTDQLQPNIHNVTDAVYSLFQAKGYTNNEIYYLTTDPNRPGYDAPATLAQLRTAITQWAKDKVSPEKALTLYLMDHGNKDKFFVDRPNQEELTPAALDSWLTELETAVPGVKINLMIEACNSGSFITGVERVSKPGRVIITSTSEQNLAYASARGAHFSDHLVTALHQGQNLFGGFWEAQTAVRQVSALQEPWLDGDGDGVANEPEDNAEAAKRGFGIGALGTEDDWPPYIASAAPVILNGQQGVIQAEVRDDQNVEDVWAVIYPPSYVAPTDSEELTPETLDTIKLLPQGNGVYAASYRAFTEIGRYRIVIQSDDGDSLEARPLTIEVVTGSKVYLPVVWR